MEKHFDMIFQICLLFDIVSANLETQVNWGYEKNKSFPKNSYSWKHVKCHDSAVWDGVRVSGLEHKVIFWQQADFGYVKSRLDTFKMFCRPKTETSSFLGCSEHLQFCKGKNFRIDFTNLKSAGIGNKYREDVIQRGQITGYDCELNYDLLRNNSDQKSPLQSWAAELVYFEVDPKFKMDNLNCDIIIDTPVFIVKLDASVSMYHHFCDFFNLYASQHINGSFSTDVKILVWDTSGYPYYETFIDAWRAFTKWPLLHINEFDQKRVCFKDAVFPLLARMHFGLYYNTPLINGCHGSGLFHAFAHNFLDRLGIKNEGPFPPKIRITFLSRTTKYRRVLNENELYKSLKTVGEYNVKLIDYNFKMNFSTQLETSRNTDILIGMHGSGLTHLLFLPDWAAVFELYNCEDKWCYLDLARLRGVRYFTWHNQIKIFPEDKGKHPTMGAHAKFTNYSFDVEEFLRLVSLAADHVRSHADFNQKYAQKTEL